jgi:hypothetical protein
MGKTEKIMTRAALWFVSLALIYGGVVSRAQAKVNFSGTWKLNTSKSDFGGAPGPQGRTDKIDHQDPNFRMSITASGAEGESTNDVAFTTDGKESTNLVNDTEVKGSAKWEGDDLVFTYTFKSGERDNTMTDRVTLSGDGKTLTRTIRWVRDGKETRQKLVFEKL